VLVSRKIQHTAELDCFAESEMRSISNPFHVRMAFLTAGTRQFLRPGDTHSRKADPVRRCRVFYFNLVVSRGQAHSRPADLCQDR